MKKRDQGILSVEASIVLTVIMMFILFLLSFAQVYSAQNLVSHAVIQSADATAMESYLRETALYGDEADIARLAKEIDNSSDVSVDSFVSLRSADIPAVVREKFISALANNESNADASLKRLGIKNGLAGVDLSGSKIDLSSNDVIVFANYTIKFKFPVMGMKEIPVTKAARAKTFGEILFGVITRAENPIMGSASGGGNYKFGTEIQIAATPNYGYKFSKWTDGNTSNPRTVTVTGAAEYVAVFEPSEFGMNLIASPSDAGTVSGAGVYKYLSTANISASPNPGYSFSKWTVLSHNDNKRVTKTTASFSQRIDQTYTCTALFTRNSYNVSVITEGGPSGAYLSYNGSIKQSVRAYYRDAVTLEAPNVSGYLFKGWRIVGQNNYISTANRVVINVPANDITYVACYESATRTVRFYTYSGALYAVKTVNKGSSLGGNMPPDPKHIGVVFKGWNGFSAYTAVYNDIDVYGNWGGCNYHRAGNCGMDHRISARQLDFHFSGAKTYLCRCIVCVDCGVFLRHNGYRYVESPGRYWTGCDMLIGRSIWCIEHKLDSNGRTGSCRNYCNTNSAGVYYVH